jgi:hypothetical protein
MRAAVMAVLLAISPLSADAQRDTLDLVIERILEIFIENIEGDDFEFNTAFENLSLLVRQPINLNKAKEEDFMLLPFLSPVQINDILNYRNNYGDFLQLEELQSVRSLDIQTIKFLLPFVTVKDGVFRNDLAFHLKNSQSTLFLKYKRIVQDRRGFIPRDEGTTPYVGNPDYYFMRYRLESGQNLRAGFTAEKDAGEPFFQGVNRYGFDFYSAFVYAERPISFIKAINIGDYSISLGQGLILHNDFGANKSAFVMNIKKGGRVIRPYSSVNEINFFRGLAMNFDLGKTMDLVVFYSNKNTNGTLRVETDTLENTAFESFSSLALSGFHRTESEIARKGTVNQINYGGRFAFNLSTFNIAVNTVSYQFSVPFVRRQQLYNQFQFTGDYLNNTSVDYNYLYKNFNFFGEYARSSNGGTAQIHSVLAGLDRRFDLALSYRKYDPDYQVIEANALSEASFPINEEAVYLGVESRLSNKWKVSAYADLWKNPWLRFRVDAPGTGREYLLRIDYIERRKLNTFLQYRYEQKTRNVVSSTETIRSTVDIILHRARLQNNYKVNAELELRSRLELSRFTDNRGNSDGVMIAQDVIYKPMGKKYSFNTRFALFDVQSFDSRIYAFENDLLYEFGIPFFQNQGSRFYVNCRYKLSRKVTWEFRYAHTYFTNVDFIGSGNERIDGNIRSDVKTQLRINF